MRENVYLTVNRSLVFVGAFALAAAQPAVTLGAPPSGSVPARPAAPAAHAAARSGSPNQGDFNVPPHLDVMKPLTMPQHLTLQSPAAVNPQPVSPYRRYGWQSMPGYLWYPTLYSPACAASNFIGSPSEQGPSDFTLGSLVDGKSNLLSPPSHNTGFATKNDAGAASSSPVTFQAGFYSAGCGAPSFTNF